ncbi:unnamed protein product [Rotaria sp. Silwood2]|nr:unnamed protein product [Rotaria sp. Silwood2]CAF2870549.1 unnamed protein product [Rotaria sp. Silwood2]CAF3121402.1 unnamed protein product [Rotaria sp. Silwood2]CAF4255850.1 unnamed protein product [Rotaria sp. Silwood2]CAF4363447.1 unnamed protein product [Rotaria sp. Silwood2]
MCIEEYQWLETLTGLKSSLLLSLLPMKHPSDGYDRCRKLIVPFGDVHAERTSWHVHQTIMIERRSNMNFADHYFVFNLNDRLGILHSLPDKYTGMTGMERAFQLLNSAGCYSDQPFDSLSLNILSQIAQISPKADYYPNNLTCMIKIDWNGRSLPYALQHFGYYLRVKKLIDMSQQFNFMHSSTNSDETLTSTEDRKHNVELLTKLYWDYRDSYNPIARLSDDMEADIILKTCSSEQY